MHSGSLAGRVAVVTGVSRRVGIGFAVAKELLAAGASVLVHSWAPRDAELPWGADPVGEAGIIEALGREDQPGAPGPAASERLRHVSADFAAPDAPGQVIAAAVEAFGAVDVVVANHARSSNHTLAEVTAAELDLTWAVNTRASVLLAQAFAAAYEEQRGAGRIIMFTSGQHLAPMSQEVPYAISKGAIQQLTLTLSDALIDRGITVNTINPGPVDTGWATPELTEQVGRALPSGRWTRPDEIAGVIRWLASPESQLITGQTINTEAGFRRWAM
ncbi:SDR family oxidoreductase [Kribbella solani]|uniref:SDR family oxidoreductase n=1 Tax=Kribbella solani TaxID=236067 RepID=UPI0029A9753A|nr:SDR family oxidoreductase [Kribbella solani]MDX2974410.1 SDR family oxidoreductase [Kribbella solani]